MIVHIVDMDGKTVHKDDHQLMIPLEGDVCTIKGTIYKVKVRNWCFETSTRRNICHVIVEPVGTEKGGLYESKLESTVGPEIEKTVNRIAAGPPNVNRIPPTDHQIDMICGHRLTPDEYEIFRKGFSWYMESNKLK